MPISYNPGINYRGGELLAGGVAQAGNALGGGLAQGLAQRNENEFRQSIVDQQLAADAQVRAEEAKERARKDAVLFDAYSKIAVEDLGMDANAVKTMSGEALKARVEGMKLSEAIKSQRAATAGAQLKSQQQANFLKPFQGGPIGGQPVLSRQGPVGMGNRYSGGSLGAIPGSGSLSRQDVIAAGLASGDIDSAVRLAALMPQAPSASERMMSDLEAQGKSLANQAKLRELNTPAAELGSVRDLPGMPDHKYVVTSKTGGGTVISTREQEARKLELERLMQLRDDLRKEGKLADAEAVEQAIKYKTEGRPDAFEQWLAAKGEIQKPAAQPKKTGGIDFGSVWDDFQKRQQGK